MTALSETASPDLAELAEHATAAFARARQVDHPFRHWLFEHAFPPQLAREVAALPISLPPALDSHGKRSSLNAHRRYFSPELQQLHPAARALAALFQHPAVVRALETLCDTAFGGSYLRIEYCQDREGFWLEPHMDIKEKLMTMQIYLNTGPDAQALGTDLYDAQRRLVGSGSGALGQGLVFKPSEPESWHGFEPRPIAGVRRSVLINYVTDAWRARHELAFPDTPIPPG